MTFLRRLLLAVVLAAVTGLSTAVSGGVVVGPQQALLSRSIDADVLKWRGAVVAAGGTISPARLVKLSTAVTKLKAIGAWQAADDYAFLNGENAIQAKITLKQRITLTVTNSPTFQPNLGYLGNRSGFIDTGWNPGSGSGWNYTQSSARFGLHVYAYATPINGDRYMGNDSNNYSELVSGSTTITGNINGSAPAAWAASSFTGLIGWSRTGASAFAGFQNGVKTVGSSGASIALVNRSFYLLASHYSGGVYQPNGAGEGIAYYGAGLPDAVAIGEQQVLRQYLNSIGSP